MLPPVSDTNKSEGKRKRNIDLARCFKNNTLWKERRVFSKAEAWIFLLGRAALQTTKVTTGMRAFTVSRGSLRTSIAALGSEWKWSRGKVSRFLELLKGEQLIEQSTDSGATVISITNFDTYTSDGTTTEQRAEQRTEKSGSVIDLILDQRDYSFNQTLKEKNNKKNISCSDPVFSFSQGDRQHIPAWVKARPGIYDQTGEGLIFLSDEEIQSKVRAWGERTFDSTFEALLKKARNDFEGFKKRYPDQNDALQRFYDWAHRERDSK